MPSIGKDLATIRKHLGMSIEDIQNATKIPLQTLQDIEDDSIFEDSDEIQTYIRSFVRTYGRKLKLDDQLVVDALDSQEVGGYNHQLLQAYPELAPEPSEPDVQRQPTSPKAPDERDTGDKALSGIDDEQETGPPSSELNKKEETETPKKKSAAEPVQKKETTSELVSEKPGVRSVNWADMGKKFSKQKSGAPVQLIGIGVIAIFVIAIAYFVYTGDFFESDQTETPPTPEETTGNDESGIPLDLSDSPDSEAEMEPATEAELSDTLFVTIYAATDRLDPVRVWSDLKPRIDPYWIEQGLALNYEFQDTIRIRGQYSRMLVFMNGHRIDDIREQYFNTDENSVELTRGIFEDDPKWASPIPLELPPNVEEPDSIANRPSF